ncbi:hypothetical protein [Deferribacter abyssi]|uniref:hypothetical protein n=1 Tax=Deferribacter abyssi TaxID=213806 RepID=UPI003C233408
MKFNLLIIIMFGILYAIFSLKTAGVTPEQLAVKKCSKCHYSLDIIKGKQLTKLEWISVLDRMQKKGANLSNKEYKIILNYLLRGFSN